MLPDDKHTAKVVKVSLFLPSYVDYVIPHLKLDNILEEIRLQPLRETFKPHPIHKNVGFVYTRMMDDESKPLSFCPRTIIEKACEEIKQLGYTVKAGIELEF